VSLLRTVATENGAFRRLGPPNASYPFGHDNPPMLWRVRGVPRVVGKVRVVVPQLRAPMKWAARLSSPWQEGERKEK